MALPGAGPAYVPSARRGRGTSGGNGLSREEASRSAGAVLRSIPWLPMSAPAQEETAVAPAAVADRPSPTEAAGAVFSKVRWTGQEVAEQGVFAVTSTKAVLDRFRWE